MKTKLHHWLVTAFAVAAFAGGQTALAQITLTINQETGAATVTNDGADVDFDGYGFGSTNGLLNPGGWVSLEDNFTPGWNELGTPSTNMLSEFNNIEDGMPNSSSTLSAGPGINFGSPFDPAAIAAAQTAAGLGVDVRDVSFGLLELGNSALTNATVVYEGDTVYNNLVLTVDTGAGTASLTNESPGTVTIDAYAIQSAAGSLDTSWNGIRDTEGAFIEAPTASANGLAEVSLASSVAIASGTSYDLGSVFTPGSDEDLSFSFLRVGEDDGDGFGGIVEYIGTDGIPYGDFDNDGDVDIVDFGTFGQNFGQDPLLDPETDSDGDGDVDIVDFGDFGIAFDMFPPSGSGSGSAIPEPASIGLVLISLIGLARRRR